MKELIRKSFSKSTQFYEKEAIIQRKTAKLMGEYIQKFDGTGVDLGCGTGFLVDFYKEKDVIGLDLSLKMIKKYKQKNPNAIVGDIENLPFKTESVDFAVSNFSLHWTDFERSVFEIFRILKSGGKFYFNVPIKDSLSIVNKILNYENFNFLTEGQIIGILQKYGFAIEKYYVREFQISFKTSMLFLEHLHKTGSMIGKKGKTLGEKKKIIKQFQSYKKPVILNYKTLFVLAEKN